MIPTEANRKPSAELKTYELTCQQVLRAIDSLQLTAKHSVATPVNWKHGEDVVVVPTLSDDQAKEKVGSYDAKFLNLHGCSHLYTPSCFQGIL